MQEIEYDEIEDFVIGSPTKDIIKYIEELQRWIDWYKIWHKKFQKQIEELTTELETYRPTKLKGNGQTQCHKCKTISWTDFGFYHYKGQTLCDKCLKEIQAKENIK